MPNNQGEFQKYYDIKNLLQFDTYEHTVLGAMGMVTTQHVSVRVAKYRRD